MILSFLCISALAYANTRMQPFSIIMGGESIYPTCVQTKTSFDDGLIKKMCENITIDDERYESCQMMSYVVEIYCVEAASSVNAQFSLITKQSQLLISTIYTEKPALINLSGLPSKMDVSMTIESTSSYFSAKSQKSHNKINLHNFFNSVNKIAGTNLELPNHTETKSIKAAPLLLEFVGNVGSKVHSLDLVTYGMVLKITKNHFDIENLRISIDNLAADSKSIRSKNLIVDPVAHAVVLGSLIQDFVRVEQYGLIVPVDYEGLSPERIQISCENEHLAFYKWDSQVSKWTDLYEGYSTIPYSFAKTFGYIGIAKYIDLSIPSLKLTGEEKINISSFLYQDVQIDSPFSLESPQQKRKLSITNSGEGWKKLENNKLPTIYLTYNKDEVEVDISKELSDSGRVQETQPSPYAPPKEPVNVGLIAGIVVACIAVIVIIVIIIVVVRKNRKSQISIES